MNEFENMALTIEYTLDSTRKRHIVGGFLLSVSLFFGGLAFTVMTIKDEENEDE